MQTRPWRVLAVAVALLLASTHAFAQHVGQGVATNSFRCVKKLPRKDLEQALARVQNRYQTLSTMRAKFNQDSYLAALDTSESSGGTVVFHKPGKMKWSYENPEQQEFVLKDHTVWYYQPEIKQVLVDEISELLLTDLPVAFLMGVGKLSEGFVLRGGCASDAGVILELDPKPTTAQEVGASRKENSLKSLSLLVSSDGFPAGVRVFDVVGNVTAIALQSVRDSQDVSESEFAVDYPKGTDVNDRRVKSKG